MAEYGHTAITFGSLKSALIYFDYVIPVFLALEMMPRKGDKKYSGPLDLRPLPNLPDILPVTLRHPSFTDQLASLNGATYDLLRKMAIERFGWAPKIAGLSESEYAAIEDTAVAAFYQFVDEFRLRALPLDCGGGVPTDEPSSDLETAISLASLDLIDTEQASWDQILEFRRDHDAQDKLRRLRLFAYENYKGKSRDFVEDDILTKIADYDMTVKKWGFETAQGALNMVLTSKVLGGVLAGSLVSTLFGAPTIAVAAAVGGGALEIGRVALEVSKQRLALRSLMRENPVSFITYAREKLQGGT